MLKNRIKKGKKNPKNKNKSSSTFLCCKSIAWGYISWMSAHFINEYISKIALLADKCQEQDDSVIPCIATANMKSGALQKMQVLFGQGCGYRHCFLVYV